MRLIDADEFNEQIGCLGLDYDDRQRIRERLNDMPTVDVVEQKHGHWIWDNDEEVWKCSVCALGDDFLTNKYCKNCGAKMDEAME